MVGFLLLAPILFDTQHFTGSTHKVVVIDLTEFLLQVWNMALLILGVSS